MAKGGRRTHASIPALGVGIVLNNSSVALLKIFLLGRLNNHLMLRLETSIAAGLHLRSLGGAATAIDDGLGVSSRHLGRTSI